MGVRVAIDGEDRFTFCGLEGWRVGLKNVLMALCVYPAWFWRYCFVFLPARPGCVLGFRFTSMLKYRTAYVSMITCHHELSQ